MKVIFKIIEGPVDPEFQVMIVRDGDKLVLGREPDKTDISFPRDGQMSSRHLQVTNTQSKCTIEDLGSTNGTILNGTPLQAGEQVRVEADDKIQCGTTVFLVQVSLPTANNGDQPEAGRETVVVKAQPQAALAAAADAPPAVAAVAAAKDEPAAAPPAATAESKDAKPLFHLSEVGRQTKGFIEPTAVAVCERFEIEDLPFAPDPEESPDGFLDRLAAGGHYQEGVIFLSYALPKRCAVWWLTRCVRSAYPKTTRKDEAVIAAAEEWVDQPIDSLRRTAMEKAQKQECETAACWAGVAAFLTHGSMTPANVPDVPPKDSLSGNAIKSGIQLAVVSVPEKIGDRLKEFYALGMSVASGENSWLK